MPPPPPCQAPGAEAVLAQLLFLQQAQAVQFDRAGDEANLTAFLHQSPDPPVIIIFLQTTIAGGVGKTKRETRGVTSSYSPGETTPRLVHPVPASRHSTLKEPCPCLQPLGTAPNSQDISGTSILWGHGPPCRQHVLRVLPPSMCPPYPGKAERGINPDTYMCLAHCHFTYRPHTNPLNDPVPRHYHPILPMKN